MATGIIVLQVDGSDIESLGGIFPSLRTARDYLVSEELEMAQGQDISAEIAQLDERLAPAGEQTTVDLMIESPFVSVNLRIMELEVRD